MSENRAPSAASGGSSNAPSDTASKSSTESVSAKPSVLPIFESFIYDFDEAAFAGDGSGRPGTIGGPIGGQNPRFRVLTYPFLPPSPPAIDKT